MMNSEYIKKLSDSINHRVYLFTPFRNILLGAGLAYCIQQENYYHIPLVIIFPSVYAGYHTFKNQDTLRTEALSFMKEMK
jgi:hypothetical protein